MNKQEVETAVVCELAHKITEEICKAKGWKLDRKEDKYGELRYTAKAQHIFDRYFDLLDNTFRN